MIKPTSAKAKGKALEDYISQQIRSKGLDRMAMRQIGSGSGKWKGDINTKMKVLSRPAVIEAKNQKNLHIPEWWKQTERQVLGYGEPILAFKEFNQPMEATKVVIYLDTFLDLCKKTEESRIAVYKSDKEQDREFAYVLNGLRLAIKRVEKHLNKYILL